MYNLFTKGTMSLLDELMGIAVREVPYVMGDMDLFTAFKERIAEDNVNKILEGVSVLNSELENYLKKQSFKSKIKKLGKGLSLDGKNWALVAFKVGGNPYVDYAKVTKSKIVLGKLLEVFLETKDIVIEEGEEFPVHIKFYYDLKNRVMKTEGYFDAEGKFFEIEDPINYKMKEIPVIIFTNNSFDTPDVPARVEPLLNLYNHLMNSIKPEWEKSKLMYINNTNFSGSQDAQELQQKIVVEGESFIDSSDPDTKLQNALAAISAGTASLESLNREIGFVENKILQLSHQFRDHAGGQYDGRTDFSLLLFNQSAFEYMISKAKHMEEQLYRFVNLVSSMLGYGEVQVKLEISEFESHRIAYLKAQSDLQVAQAEQARGIASKNHAEAKALGEGKIVPEQVGAL